MSLRLIVDDPLLESSELNYLTEEKNKNEPSTLYIHGPFLCANVVNRNSRKYKIDEMANEVSRYTAEMINNKRSIGELNHPQSVDINPRDACHLITELKQNGNVFIGKSKILTTPMGQIVRSLILDGVKLGISSRALGKLSPQDGGKFNLVEDFKLVTCDIVTDPSAPGCYLNGILEGKEYVINADGTISEAVNNIYNNLENKLATLPKHDVNEYLKNSFNDFIKSLKQVCKNG